MIYKLKLKSLISLINHSKIKSISTNNSIISNAQKLKCLSLFKLNKLKQFFFNNNAKYNHIFYFLIQALIRNQNLKKDLIQNGHLIKNNL